jgi:hypothetical protein
MSPLVEKLAAEFISNLDNGIELIFPLEGAASVNDSPGAIKRFGCRFGFSFLLRGKSGSEYILPFLNGTTASSMRLVRPRT